MSYDAYRFFPQHGTTHAHSTMFPPEVPYTREPVYPGEMVTMKGRQIKPTTRTQPVNKLTNTAKECLTCIKRGHLNRAAVHSCLPHRTLDAVGSGIRVLIRLGFIQSVRVGKCGNRYDLLKKEDA